MSATPADIENALLSDGHTDEFLLFKQLLTEVEHLRLAAESKSVCPHCKTSLRPTRFKGYYDSFDCWTCECGELPDAVVVKGAYA